MKLEKDKKKHLVAGFLIVIVATILIEFSVLSTLNYWFKYTIALTLGTLGGLTKDVFYDLILGRGKFEWLDILATILGSVLGVIFLIITRLIFN